MTKSEYSCGHEKFAVQKNGLRCNAMHKFVVILTLLPIIGCTSTATIINRGVIDKNIFFSEKYPELSIKIEKEFFYLGHFYEKKYEKYLDVSGGSYHDVDYFYFVKADKNKKISKLIEIRINKIRSGWLGSEMFPWMKPNYNSGTIEYLGKNYQYGTTVAGFGSGENSNFILEKGYILPNSLLVKGIGRRLGNNNNMAFHVYYVEDINEIGGKYTQIKDWKKESGLNEEQKTILNSFLARAESSFSIVKIGAPKK